jgi:regulator of extracellular matrix RemA (YlzA/DUF370 family)
MVDSKRIEDIQGAIVDKKPLPPEVYIPPTIRGKKSRAVSIQVPVELSEHIVRITNDGDPIGQLIALMNGQPVPSFVVTDDGELDVILQTATVAQRISIAKWLGDRIIPKTNLHLKKDLDNEWEAISRNAAQRSENASGGEGIPILDGESG